MTRRAFITGVSGFTGRHLAARLLGSGWQVAGTTRSRSSGVPGVVERRVDAGDTAALAGFMSSVRPHVVFHLAAVVDTVRSRGAQELFRVNTLGTVAALEAARQTPSVATVVLASSALAYGQLPSGLAAVTESAQLRPVTAYGSSKAAAEVIALQWWRETGTDVVIARGFQHTGPGHVGPYALADWARLLAGGATELEVGNLDVVRDYLDVRDAAAAYQALADSGRPGEAYNVASGEPRSMRSILEALLLAFGTGARIRVDPTRFRVGDQPRIVADTARIRQHTGWSPVIPFEQTLGDLAAWARAAVAT